MNKEGMSPLIATILLVVFALIIGTATMNWGKSYVEKINTQDVNLNKNEETFKSSIVLDINSIDTPLKELQIKHITGKISQEQYLAQEKTLITS